MRARSMSAFPPKAAAALAERRVRFGPEADTAAYSIRRLSVSHRQKKERSVRAVPFSLTGGRLGCVRGAYGSR
jgi:hypothetical protein